MGRRSGVGITGLVIVGGVLYFSGAGAWLWNRTKELDTSCYSLLSQVGTQMGTTVCDGIGYATDKVSQAVDAISAKIHDRMGDSGAQLEAQAHQLFARISEQSRLPDMTSSGKRLKEMMQERPALMGEGSSARERMRAALDQFVIGQHYLSEASPTQAQRWFQQSANQPDGFGVLSQLQLGDMYRTGAPGVAQDTNAAQHYYEQARRSLQQLQQSNTRESQAMLQSLPGQPERLQQEISQRIELLK